MGKTCDGIEERKGFNRSRYALFYAGGQYAGKQMSSITMIVWKMIEILQKFLNMWSRWKKGFEFETCKRVKEWRRTFDSFFQKNVGFHNIKQANLKSPSKFPSFFLPYRVPLNLSSSLHHCI